MNSHDQINKLNTFAKGTFGAPCDFLSKDMALDHMTSKKEGIKGLCVGKFWPVHNGHIHLIREGMKHCDQMYVIVCDKPGIHFPSGLDRVECIRKTIPQCYVMCINDVYDSDDSELWAKLVKSWCKFVPDIVFTSETYGEKWAGYLGCKHMLIDINRTSFPVSGTLVRSNYSKYWSMLPPATRSLLCKRIVFVGSESTGKTTIATELAKTFGTLWVPEYGREMSERKNSERKPDQEFDFSDEDFADIIRSQSLMEYEAATKEENGGILFCDTNCFATLIWYKRYQKKDPPSNIMELFSEYYHTPTLYIFMRVEGSEFIQDGLRDGEHIREQMDTDFYNALENQKVPYITIDGPFNDRKRQIILNLLNYIK